MKMPIKWHEECLENRRKGLQRNRDAFERMRACLEREESEVSLYESQIDRAKREGRKSFDRERFNVSRKTHDATINRLLEEEDEAPHIDIERVRRVAQLVRKAHSPGESIELAIGFVQESLAWSGKEHLLEFMNAVRALLFEEDKA